MVPIYPAVLAQVKFACAVNAFIQELLQAVLPGLARNRTLFGADQFQIQLDAVFAELDPLRSDEMDYRRAVASAACIEVSSLCELLTGACECAGLADIAKRYLDQKRFLKLVLRQNTEKLDALTAIVHSGDKDIGRLLMRVGAALDGRIDTYDDMEPAAKRKASDDTRKIIEEVQRLATGVERKIDESRSEIVDRVDDVGAKVGEVDAKIDRLKLKGKRRSKYTDAQREACYAYWSAARSNAELKYASAKGVTHGAAFNWYKRELADAGITSVKQFTAILNAIKSKACDERRKALEAKIEAERKAKRRR